MTDRHDLRRLALAPLSLWMGIAVSCVDDEIAPETEHDVASENVAACEEFEDLFYECDQELEGEILYPCDEHANVADPCSYVDIYACMGEALGECDETTNTFPEYDPEAMDACSELPPDCD